MVQMNRRKLLGTGAGVVGAAALGGTPAAAAPKPPHPHLFHFGDAEVLKFDGGTLQGANQDNFPVLTGKNGSVYLATLEVGGIREPHWHPIAWELTYIISGSAKWTILGTHSDGAYHQDVFSAGEGDLVFIPEGFFHYFENASGTEPLRALVVFNTSTPEPNDDLGVVGAFNSMPRDVLATVFGVPQSAFDGIPAAVKPVVIAKRKA